MIKAFMAKHNTRSAPAKTARRKPRGAGGKKRPKPATGETGFWLYGTHAVLAALANPERGIQRLVIAAQSAENLESRVEAAAAKAGVPRPRPEIRDRGELQRLVPPGARHQGLCVAAGPLPEPGLAQIRARAHDAGTAVVVALDQATDPRNVGAVVRSAAAFGAIAVIIPARGAPPATGVLAKAASGALETLPLVRVTNLVRALEDLKAAGFWCWGLAAEAETRLADMDKGGKVALVLGAEGKGLRRLTRETCDALARIPTAGPLQNLNVSVAAAISLYELDRGRRG